MLLSLLASIALIQPEAPPVLPPQTRPAAPAPKPQPEPARPSATVEAEGVGEPILTIIFEGVEAPAAVARAAEAFLGRPATRETLVELAAALSRAYERTDVALYTVAIPKQDFKDGVVVVQLVEGWVDSVRLTSAQGQQYRPRMLEMQANRVVGQKPLSRRLYERQSSLMQSLPGLTIEQGFENPEGDESVAWTIDWKQKRAEIASGINNRGPHLLGDLVFNTGVDFYRMLFDGDQLSFTAGATPNLKNYRAIEGAYSMPLGSDGLRVTGTMAWVGTRARSIDVKGEATLAAITLTYPVLRLARQAADISLAIDGINAENALFGNIFATERSRAARLSSAYVSATAAHNLTATATLSRGLDIFGARVDPATARANFIKVNGTIAYERLFASKLLGRVNAVAQYSGDRLPAAELFSVGGPLIGRAFDTGLLTGDRGAGGFVEFAYRPIRAENFARSETYLFADAATLTVERRDPFPETKFSLASAGAGVRIQYKDRAQLGLEAAAVLDKPFAGYAKDWRLSFYYAMLF